MATAKQIFYNPSLALLPKRKDTTTPITTPITTTTTHHHHHHQPHHPQRGATTLTVTIPFAFSTRLSRLDDKPQRSAASIRRSRTTPRPTPRATPRATPRTTTTLPRLAQPSARPSHATSGSTATRSGSSARRPSSGYGMSSQSALEEARVVVPDVDWGEEEKEEEEELSPEEEEERRLNAEKCRQWLQGLPEKFSGMHVVQHVVHTGRSAGTDGAGQCMFLSS